MIQRLLSSRRSEGLFAALSILVLLVCSYYAFLLLRVVAFTGLYDPLTWRVLDDQPGCEEPQRCLQENDQILALNGVTREQYLKLRTATGIDWLEEVTFRVLRGESELAIVVRAEDLQTTQVLSAVSVLLLPALFWLMGTVAVIFLRPRDSRWLVLVLFFHVTAVLFAAGALSWSLMAYSSVVLHLFTWLFCALLVHVHLVVPDASFPRARRALPLLYVAALLAMVLDLTLVLDTSASYVAALSALVVSLGIVVWRQLLPAAPAIRVANRLMLFGVTIGTVPWVGMLLVLTWFPLPDLAVEIDRFAIAIGGLLALPNWPLSYLYAMYKYEEGTIQLRANRLLGRYSFLSLYVIFFVVTYALIGSRVPMASEHPLFTSLLISLVFVALAPLLHQRFQLLIDRTIFGIRYQPQEVVGFFAQRLPSAFDRARLKRLIMSEVLPTLQIRQSGLYLLQQKRIERLYAQNVPPDGELRSPAGLAALLAQTERYIPFDEIHDRRFAWVRLVIPLTVQEQPIGVWLLGKRDPDDFYPRSDVNLLRNLANQIATVLRAQTEILENRQLQKQLLHAQKMETIGRLTAGISHDFNNILAAILGYGNLLLDHTGADDPLSRKYLSGILEAGHKAEGLAKQLLSFSRPQGDDVRVVDVDEAVRGMENMLRRVLAEDIELLIDLASRSRVRIDPSQLEQVVLNLVVNAGDAMPDGGLLAIESENVERRPDADLPHPQVSPGHYVQLRVRDTGVGIEPQIQPHIFEPFYTTKEERGTGLGLATVYGIVHQCGGEIVAESRPGQGTTFHIYLPVTAAEDVATETPTVTIRGGVEPHGSETVLVAEDDEVVRSVVGEILRARGYQVLQAADGRAALDLVDRQEEDTIDLLVTDVMMPHMKGDELARRLRGRFPALRVIYMSGYGRASARVRELGDDDAVLLQKPFPPETLVRTVRQVLTRTASFRVH